MRYIALLLAVIPALPAKASEISIDRHVVMVRGRLEKGDTGRVQLAVSKVELGGQEALLELNSDGGDGKTGLLLAEYVASSGLTVIVNRHCWSACSYPALVALGRGKLVIGPEAEVGVHQVYGTLDGKTDIPWTIDAARQLRKIGAPKKPLEDMIKTAADWMKIYEYDELIDMGAVPWE
jgi:hypothetical protein